MIVKQYCDIVILCNNIMFWLQLFKPLTVFLVFQSLICIAVIVLVVVVIVVVIIIVISITINVVTIVVIIIVIIVVMIVAIIIFTRGRPNLPGSLAHRLLFHNGVYAQ